MGRYLGLILSRFSGGSLTVQIFGASSESQNVDTNEVVMGSDKNERKKAISASPVMIRSSSSTYKRNDVN